MKKATCWVALAALMMLNTGCANGPLARFLRGGECDSCSAMPAPADTYPHAYTMETSGTCGPNGCNGYSAPAGGEVIGGWMSGGTTTGNVDLNGGLPVGGTGISPGPN